MRLVRRPHFVVAATIVANAELALGRVAAQSFKRWHPEIPFFVLLADQRQGWAPAPTDDFTLIEVDELAIESCERMRFGYGRLAFSYACTPFLLTHLLRHVCSCVLFYKQESLVLGDQRRVLDRLNENSLLLTPHLHAPLEGRGAEERELNILTSGLFNSGLLGVRDTSSARRFLAWWCDRLRRHCRHDLAGGMHYEQRWLDLAPSLFDGVEVMRDPGANFGHWSLPQHEVSVEGTTVLVDGRPCTLFRFSGHDPARPEAVTRYSPRLSAADLCPAAASVFERYRRALRDAGHEHTQTLPYAYQRFDNGVVIPAVARAAYLDLEHQARFGDPFATVGPNSLWNWLTAPVDDSAPALTRLWQLVWSAREDLRRAFPDYLRRDRDAFLNWASSQGRLEHEIAVELSPRSDPS